MVDQKVCIKVVGFILKLEKTWLTPGRIHIRTNLDNHISKTTFEKLQVQISGMNNSQAIDKALDDFF